jgi:hypothetical protein
MTNTNTDAAIRSRIDSFLTELGALVKKSALEAVQEALGEGAPRRRGPGRPTGSGRRGPGRPPKAGRRRAGRPARGGKRIRRSSEDLAKIGARVLAQVRSHAGQRLEEIGRALKTDTAILKKPVADLLKAKKVRTKGQKRGTMYFAGSGSAKKAASKPKRRVRRPAKSARKARVLVRRPAKRARKASPKRSARRATPRIVTLASPHKKRGARKRSRTAPISPARAMVNELAMEAAAMSTALP